VRQQANITAPVKIRQMENQSSQEHTPKKKQTTKNGTMTFIDHLDELRKRLIRFIIVMTLCVLVMYAFRKDILDLIRKPVDAPLKKYTSSTMHTQTRPNLPIQSLNSYNCSCEDIQSTVAVPVEDKKEKQNDKDTVESTEKSSTGDEASDLENISEKAGQYTDIAKETINDFVVFFQALLGKDPSPVFETEKYLPASQQENRVVQNLPGQLNLHCQCTLASSDIESQSTHSSMVFIGLPELFFAQMKVAIFAGFFIAFPYLLIEIWGFVGPALYRGERKIFWIFSIASYFFFIGGALFGYFVVFPYGFDFFLSLTQMGEIMPSLSVGEYLGFALKLLLAFGFIFELPLATFILARMGIITPEIMIKQSRVAILVIFILSAILTPPDPFTMVLMAGPLILLYIISIGVCFVGVNRQKAALREQGIDTEDL